MTSRRDDTYGSAHGSPAPEPHGSDGDPDVGAEWFERFLQQLLDGERTDLRTVFAERPDLAARREEIEEALELARSIAPRRGSPVPPRFSGYEIVRELGHGGMAVVYLARQESLGREVALKVLPVATGLSARARRRFIDEARALARVHDEHIVEIHDVLEHDGALAYAMERVEGKSLREVIDALRALGRRPSLDDMANTVDADKHALHARHALDYFVALGIDIARALAKVHAAGLVHRDVKPSNVLIRRDGQALLADFGLVRDTESTRTRTGSFVGTPVYAAPEQLRAGEPGTAPMGSAAVDGRADQYALAVTLYEAIALALPVASGRDTSEQLARIETGQVRRLRKVAPHAPRDLETILHKAMEPRPADRYATIDEFADDLGRLRRFEPIRARRPHALRRAVRLVRRQRRTLVAAAVGAVALASVLLPVWLHQSRVAANRVRAAELVESARRRLLSSDVFFRVWDVAASSLPRGARQSLVGSQALDHALAHYDAALEFTDRATGPGVERDVVAFVHALRPAPLPAEATDLPASVAVSCPLTGRAMEQVVSGIAPDPPREEELAGASAQDLCMLGFLGFLTGNVTLSERGWTRTHSAATEFPFADAALGIMLLADDRPALAYSRLRVARPSFPDVPLLAAALAEAALATGEDPRSVEDWLAEADSFARENAGARCALQQIQADLLVARGDLGAARHEYESVTYNIRIEFRLAQLDLREGNPEAAIERLRPLVQCWPEQGSFRLELARAALAHWVVAQDLASLFLYLDQVFEVLVRDYGAGRSAGTVDALLEILAIGGLHGLVAKGLQRSGSEPRWRKVETPVIAWNRLPFGSREQVEDHLELLARLREKSPAILALGWGSTTSLVPTPPPSLWRAAFLLFESTVADHHVPRGAGPQWSTYLGGTGDDFAMATHVAPDGLVTVAGLTDSVDFPVTAGAFQTEFGGAKDVFVARFDPARSGSDQMLWCTLVGGTGDEYCFDLHVDSTGVTTIVGLTLSPDFPVTSRAFQSRLCGGSDAFLAQLDPNGARLLYGSYLGGGGDDRFCAVAADATGALLLGGHTNSADFPTTPETVAPGHRGEEDACVVRFDTSRAPAEQVIWATYLGGSGPDGMGFPVAGFIQLDFMDLQVGADGVVTLVGPTRSDDFPVTPGCLQPARAGARDVFFTQLDATGSTYVYSTYLGGAREDRTKGLARHPDGGFVVTGHTSSDDFPTTPGAYSRRLGAHLSTSALIGNSDPFVAWLDPGRPGSEQLRYGSYIPAAGGEDPVIGIAIESSGVVTLCGYSLFGDFPTTAGSYQPEHGEVPADGTVARLALRGSGSSDLLYASFVGGAVGEMLVDVALGPRGEVTLVGTTSSPDYPLQGPYQRTFLGGNDVALTRIELLPAGVERYGDGGPARAAHPYAGVGSWPQRGNRNFAVHVTGVAPCASGMLLFGLRGAAHPIPHLGIDVLLDPLISGVRVTADRLGFAEVRMPIPTAATPGERVALQWLFPADPSCPEGPLLTSDALELTIQR